MAEHKYLFVEPGRDRRQRRERLKELVRAPAGEARTHGLAALAREFHEARELNLAMDTARQCLHDDDRGSAFLIEAYVRTARDDQAIEDLAMLTDMARWLEHEGLRALVATMTRDTALSWCGTADGRERERRVDTLRRRFDDQLADEVDLALY